MSEKEPDHFDMAFVGSEDQRSDALGVDPIYRRTGRDQSGRNFEMAVAGRIDQSGVAG